MSGPPQTIVYGGAQIAGSKRLPQTLVIIIKR